VQTHAATRLVKSGRSIWALICLELWFQVYMDGSGARPSELEAGITVAQGA
jgi:hypothetical protein